MRRKLSEALWSDCENDEDRFNFLVSGRAYETGIIASSIQNEVAMAYQYRAEMQKHGPVSGDVKYIAALEAWKKAALSIIGQMIDENEDISVYAYRTDMQDLADLAPKRSGIGLIDRCEARGFDPAEPEDSQREIDRMTGKRIGEA